MKNVCIIFLLSIIISLTALGFGGVFENSTIWVNGEKAGENKYGYSSFETDIADRMMSNIQQKINRFTSLRNLFVSFRVETSKAY